MSQLVAIGKSQVVVIFVAGLLCGLVKLCDCAPKPGERLVAKTIAGAVCATQAARPEPVAELDVRSASSQVSATHSSAAPVKDQPCPDVAPTLLFALQKAAIISSPEERELAMERICQHWAEADPASAVVAVQRFQIQRPALLENLAEKWATVDIAAASAWALSQYPGRKRDELIARVAFVQAQTVPDQAAALVVQCIPPGPAQNEAAMAVLHQWALQDLPAASQWVDQFPDGRLRLRAISELEGIANRQQTADQIQ